MENKVIELEELCKSDYNNHHNLNEAKAKLTHFQDMEETYWRQKATIKYITDENINTKYFHAIVNKKIIIHVHKIRNEQGEWCDD